MKIHPYGDRALLLELSGQASVLEWTQHLRSLDLPGVLDIIPGARSIALSLHTGASARAIAVALGSTRPSGTLRAEPDDVLDIPVTYDGADIDTVAALLEVGVEELVTIHTTALWEVAFTGFAPGYGYLTSKDCQLNVPRRPDPRPRVPAGAVALAAGYCGIYPTASPGGWQLIGNTTARLWDIDRRPPALLSIGTRIRFSRAVAP